MAENTEEQDVTALRRKAYGAATTRLRDANRAEFEELYADECEALGVPYTRRLTPEQKAAEQIKELLEQHPELRGQVATLVSEDETSESARPEFNTN